MEAVLGVPPHWQLRPAVVVHQVVQLFVVDLAVACPAHRLAQSLHPRSLHLFKQINAEGPLMPTQRWSEQMLDGVHLQCKRSWREADCAPEVVRRLRGAAADVVVQVLARQAHDTILGVT